MQTEYYEELSQSFNKAFARQLHTIYFCPGRINLIGEHIDYNGGLVMPCAIQMGTYLCIAPNDNDVIRFKSVNFATTIDIPIKGKKVKSANEWFNYPLGVIDFFLLEGHDLSGLDLLFFGDLPIGAGLSSSASIEMVTAFAINNFFNLGYKLLDLVRLCQSVENKFIGVKSGVMDQYAVAFGAKDKAMVLNCQTLASVQISANIGPYALAIINTNKPRVLAESKYNERVEECNKLIALLKTRLQNGQLCDMDPDQLPLIKPLISDENLWKRITHVVEENNRVRQAAEYLISGNLDSFGILMFESHNSLKNLYEVSGIELDTIVGFSESYPGVIGARMTGAGFGGCAIALVDFNALEKYSIDLKKHYKKVVGYEPEIYQSKINGGVCAAFYSVSTID